METKIDSRIIGIFAILGIMMIVAAIYMNWVSVIDTYSGYSGFQVGDLVSDSDYDDWQQNVPMIVFILGLIMLILELISILMPEKSKKIEAVMPTINFIFGLIILIVCICFAVWDLFDYQPLGEDVYKAGAGVWVALIGALIGICGNAGQVFATYKKKEA
ncbi:MAG: hypothetical protein ACOX8X_02785 [Methanomethylophilus sp.]|jgi:amino acid transporter